MTLPFMQGQLLLNDTGLWGGGMEGLNHFHHSDLEKQLATATGLKTH